MKSHATIACRVVRILGHPNSGRSPADLDDDNALEVEFRFEITDDGNKNFLLVYQSLDGRYAADELHETVEAASASAEESFGIVQSEWMTPNTRL